ncbi:hypothetical protein QM012_001664 [Aureobasidium pullulans]|uniref:Uncharacterized protein n=1 Tax=Aureobasidium pullulans TaxID=5580 RepID=A0ABR0TES3_AURPU
MDQVPPWQHINEGYESPTEATFKRINPARTLEEWKERNSQRALEILGKNNTKLRQPAVRYIIWPAEKRHTDAELQSIWKYSYTRCWHYDPYAFNSDLKPYAEFAWVTSPTAFRHPTRNASRTIAPEPATVTAPFVSAGKQTASTLDNRRYESAIVETIKAEPPPNAP